MLLPTHRKHNIINFISQIIIELFKMSLITYLVIYLINVLTNTNIKYYFDLNSLLYIAIITGVLSTFLKTEDVKEFQKNSNKKIVIISGISSIVAAGMIYFRINEIGKLSYLISITVLLIVFIITYNLQIDNKNDYE